MTTKQKFEVDSKWSERINPLPRYSKIGTTAFDVHAWKSQSREVIRTLKDLLAMEHYKFWSQMVYFSDPYLNLLDSFLINCPRLTEPTEMKELYFSKLRRVAKLQNEIYRLFGLLFCRLSAEGLALMSSEQYMENIVKTKVFTPFRLAGICSVYPPTKTNTLVKVCDAQPDLLTDAVSAIMNQLHRMKLDLHGAWGYAKCQPTLENKLDMLADLGLSMGHLIDAVPCAGSAFRDAGILSLLPALYDFTIPRFSLAIFSRSRRGFFAETKKKILRACSMLLMLYRQLITSFILRHVKKSSTSSPSISDEFCDAMCKAAKHLRFFNAYIYNFPLDDDIMKMKATNHMTAKQHMDLLERLQGLREEAERANDSGESDVEEEAVDDKPEGSVATSIEILRHMLPDSIANVSDASLEECLRLYHFNELNLLEDYRSACVIPDVMVLLQALGVVLERPVFRLEDIIYADGVDAVGNPLDRDGAGYQTSASKLKLAQKRKCYWTVQQLRNIGRETDDDDLDDSWYNVCAENSGDGAGLVNRYRLKRMRENQDIQVANARNKSTGFPDVRQPPEPRLSTYSNRRSYGHGNFPSSAFAYSKSFHQNCRNRSFEKHQDASHSHGRRSDPTPPRQTGGFTQSVLVDSHVKSGFLAPSNSSSTTYRETSPKHTMQIAPRAQSSVTLHQLPVSDNRVQSNPFRERRRRSPTYRAFHSYSNQMADRDSTDLSPTEFGTKISNNGNEIYPKTKDALFAQFDSWNKAARQSTSYDARWNNNRHANFAEKDSCLSLDNASCSLGFGRGRTWMADCPVGFIGSSLSLDEAMSRPGCGRGRPLGHQDHPRCRDAINAPIAQSQDAFYTIPIVEPRPYSHHHKSQIAKTVNIDSRRSGFNLGDGLSNSGIGFQPENNLTHPSTDEFTASASCRSTNPFNRDMLPGSDEWKGVGRGRGQPLKKRPVSGIGRGR